MEYIFSTITIIALLGLIVSCCVVFTNAIEHLGKSYNLGDGAVGSILAAIGTALPETIVPLVAIFGAYFTNSSLEVGNEIGIGAILGSPFLLSTLAMLVTGLAIIIFTKSKNRKIEIKPNTYLLKRDLRFFLICYTIAVISTFIPFYELKLIIGVLLLIIYIIYVFRTLDKCANGACETNLDELMITRLFKTDKFKIYFIWFQIILSIGFLIIFSHMFVENIKFISNEIGVSPLIVSLLLAPVATELPEMFNSVLWVRNSKDTLALSNITGAIVFQSCIPMSIGIFFTDWKFTDEAIVNIILVYIAVLALYINIIRSKQKLTVKTLLISGFFYIIYIAFIIAHIMVH